MYTPVSNLTELLRSLQPVLNDGVYVFAVLPAGTHDSSINPIATFHEQEGLTVIVEESAALGAGLPVLFRCAWITLTVHSDLHAVGLTAAVAAALSHANISCNVVAAAFHDHLFVPYESGSEAVAVLQALQQRS